MDLTRFKFCADAYGAARRRWPERDRALYDRFAATPEGAAILAEATRGDRLLDAYAAAAPAPQLARRVRAIARPAWRRYAVPAALAASAVLGFALGFAQARADADTGLAARLLFGPRSVQEIGL
jgi:hypothetical protein